MAEGLPDEDPLLLFSPERPDSVAAPSHPRPSHLAPSDGDSLLAFCPEDRVIRRSLPACVRDRVRATAVLIRARLRRAISAASASAVAVSLAGYGGVSYCRSRVSTWRRSLPPLLDVVPRRPARGSAQAMVAWCQRLVAVTSRPHWSLLAFGLSTFVCGVAIGALFIRPIRAPDERTRTPLADRATTASGIVAGRPSDTAAAPVSTPPVQLAPPTVAGGPSPLRGPSRNVATPAAGRSATRRATRTETPFRGSLTVQSRPPGADVFVNGRRAGTTPLTLRDAPAGSRAVRVTLNGYEVWTSSVRIVADQRNVVTANLRATSVNALR